MRRMLCVFACLLGGQAKAIDLVPSGGSLIADERSAADSVRLPRAPWTAETVAPEQSGALRRAVFQVANPSLTTLQLVDPLRTQLLDAGYTEVFSCADDACGGFDFRFQLDLLPAPTMFVDLGNYRYLLMENPDAVPETVSIVASSSASFGYVHVTEVFQESELAPVQPSQSEPEPSPEPNDLIADLIATGHAVLSDLDFATGSAELGVGPYASLQALSDWLEREPSARIVLVGHTDAVGALDANLSLSRRRALSVEARLVNDLGASASQVFSDGAGALSPIASNLTAEGRGLNRRVEVVLLGLN